MGPMEEPRGPWESDEGAGSTDRQCLRQAWCGAPMTSVAAPVSSPLSLPSLGCHPWRATNVRLEMILPLALDEEQQEHIALASAACFSDLRS